MSGNPYRNRSQSSYGEESNAWDEGYAACTAELGAKYGELMAVVRRIESDQVHLMHRVALRAAIAALEADLG